MTHKLLALLLGGCAAWAVAASEPAQVRADDWEDYWEDYWDDFRDYRDYRRNRYQRYYNNDYGYRYQAPTYRYYRPYDDYDRSDYGTRYYRYDDGRPRYYDGRYGTGYYGPYYRTPQFSGQLGPLRLDVWD